MRHDHFVHVSGVFLSFNLSPKGIPEGFVCRQGKSTFQVNFPPELTNEVAKRVSEGVKVEAEVTPFRDAEEEAHPVYELRSLMSGDQLLVVDGGGEEDVHVAGTIVRLNYAKRGEVNGAILDTGEFVHLRPHGARELELKIGQQLKAEGEVRPGWAGARVIEATRANGISIEKPKKKRGPLHHPPHHRADHELHEQHAKPGKKHAHVSH
jgi:hypothetical protein